MNLFCSRWAGLFAGTCSVLLMTILSPAQTGIPGMPKMPGSPTAASAPVPAPQALGPKAPGKIRIGVAPAQAQLGQGNNAQADYSAPIRNSWVLIMSGPAIEIVALDSRLPIQLQAEAQQMQCDYVLYSAVEVKHSSGGIGAFMKKAGPLANFTPMGMLMNAGSMAAKAGQIAGQVSAMTAQQQAVSQLAQFNGQIKQKDDVSIGYQLVPTGQDKPKLESTLKGKAKSDGEDVLTPLMQQAASTVLTEVAKK